MAEEEQELIEVEDSASASVMKFILCGDEKVGKTTLRKALTASPWETWVSGVATPNDSTPGEGRTRGVEVNKARIGKVKISFWDVGGQEQYDILHQFVYGGENCLFVVVLDTRKPKRETLQTLARWLRRIRARLSTGLRGRVYVIGNQRRKHETCACMKEVIDKARKIFEDKIDIEDFQVIDCSNPRETWGFQQQLQAIHKDVLSHAIPVPKCCDKIFEALPLLRKKYKANPIAPMRTIAPMATAAVRPKIARYIYRAGECLQVDVNWQYVILRVSWLLHDVLGKIFADRDWGDDLQMDAVVGIEYLKEKYSDWDVDAIVTALCSLQLALRCKRGNQDAILLPSLLEGRQDIPKKFPICPDAIVIGRQIICKGDNDIFTAGLFPYLQVQLWEFGKETNDLWEGGSLIAQYGAEGIVQIDNDHRCIEIHAQIRCPNKKDRPDFIVEILSLVCHTMNIIRTGIQEVCPGIDTEEKIVHITNEPKVTTTAYGFGQCEDKDVVITKGKYHNVVEMITGSRDTRLSAAIEKLRTQFRKDRFLSLIPRDCGIVDAFPLKKRSQVVGYDLFLAHSGADKRFAIEIYMFLSLMGLNVWFDVEDVSHRKALFDSVIGGLSGAQHLLSLVTPDFFKSEWPQKETWSFVVDRHLVNTNGELDYGPLTVLLFGTSTNSLSHRGMSVDYGSLKQQRSGDSVPIGRVLKGVRNIVQSELSVTALHDLTAQLKEEFAFIVIPSKAACQKIHDETIQAAGSLIRYPGQRGVNRKALHTASRKVLDNLEKQKLGSTTIASYLRGLHGKASGQSGRTKWDEITSRLAPL